MITGAASGIGRASAILFAREGASVIAADLSAAVEETVAEIHQAGGKAAAMIGDAGNEDDVIAWVDACTDRFGRLDAVYANAGRTGRCRRPPRR